MDKTNRTDLDTALLYLIEFEARNRNTPMIAGHQFYEMAKAKLYETVEQIESFKAENKRLKEQAISDRKAMDIIDRAGKSYEAIIEENERLKELLTDIYHGHFNLTDEMIAAIERVVELGEK